MESAPDITVIIPTYNNSGVLSWALKSVLNQTFTNFEVWIVGDNCTDETEQVVNSLSDPRLHWFNRGSNSGSSPAPINEALKRAKGNYIAYLGHDDLWMPWHLANLHQYTMEQDADLCYAMQAVVTPTKIGYLQTATETRMKNDFCFVSPSGWFHKKSLVEKAGYWEEDHLSLYYPPDMEFSKRIVKTGAKIISVPELSVIKFPSPEWNSYQHKTALALEMKKYFSRIETDPKGLQIELLTRIVFDWELYRGSKITSLAKTLRMLFRSLKREVISLYGADRFPLRQILRDRYLKDRRKVMRMRGLD